MSLTGASVKSVKLKNRNKTRLNKKLCLNINPLMKIDERIHFFVFKKSTKGCKQ